MKNITAFRSASILLIIFCLMHTGGGMLAQKSLGPASDAVFDAMKSVHFNFNGADCTWYGFWFGFGLTASIFLLLSALVAWELGRVPNELWPRLTLISWAFVVSHVANTVLAWKYFFAGPGVFGTIISLLLAAGTLRKSRRAAELSVPR
jgi:hypothetical protein